MNSNKVYEKIGQCLMLMSLFFLTFNLTTTQTICMIFTFLGGMAMYINFNNEDKQ